MPLLHSAFRPHTTQLHSISRSNEANWLAGLCYITTLNSFYNSLCTKLLCTCTPAQENAAHVRMQKSYKYVNTSSKHENAQWHVHVKTNTINYTHNLAQTHTHPLLPSLPPITPHSVLNALQENHFSSRCCGLDTQPVSSGYFTLEAAESNVFPLCCRLSLSGSSCLILSLCNHLL